MRRTKQGSSRVPTNCAVQLLALTHSTVWSRAAVVSSILQVHHHCQYARPASTASLCPARILCQHQPTAQGAHRHACRQPQQQQQCGCQEGGWVAVPCAQPWWQAVQRPWHLQDRHLGEAMFHYYLYFTILLNVVVRRSLACLVYLLTTLRPPVPSLPVHGRVCHRRVAPDAVAPPPPLAEVTPLLLPVPCITYT